MVGVCRGAGKHPGLGGISRYEAGAGFVLSGSDLAFMMAGAQMRTGVLRGLVTAPAA